MNQFGVVLLIGAAGALGAWTRYGTTLAMNRIFGEGFLLGTLTVNVVGCFCIGVLVQLGEQHLSQHWKVVIGAGFLGALTTFSTLGLETVLKFHEGETILAVANIGLNLLLGISAVILGMYLADTWTATE